MTPLPRFRDACLKCLLLWLIDATIPVARSESAPSVLIAPARGESSNVCSLKRRLHWLDVVRKHSRSARRNSSERSVKKPRCRNGSSAAPKATIAPDPAPRWANLLSRLSGTHLAVNFVDALASARFRRKVFACAPGEFVQALKCSRSPLIFGSFVSCG